jgi:hypothetical protein
LLRKDNVIPVLNRGQEFYNLNDFLQLSPGGTPYVWLCSTVMLCGVGKKAWGKKKLKVALSDIVTCRDEAFVLLTLENNYDCWMAECKWLIANKDKEPTERDEKTFPVSKYTNSGKSQCNGRSRQLSGWARKGYLKFNELYMLVRQDWQQR